MQMFPYSKTTQKNLNLLKGEAKRIFELLLQECYKQGINAQISESIRTKEKQLELYNSGKSKAKEVYQSMHFYGLACDIFVNNSGKYDLSQNEKIWKICQNLKLDIEHGMTWGGNFKSIKDQPHFELSWGKSWRDFYKLYQQNPNQEFALYKKSSAKESSVAKIEQNATQSEVDIKKVGNFIFTACGFFLKEFKEVYKFFLSK